MKTILGAILAVLCVGAVSCSEDEGPKYPLVESECESHDECTAGEFCLQICNLVGGYEDHPSAGCNYVEGAVGEKYVNQCIPVDGCNNSTTPENVPMVFEGRNFKAEGSLCHGALETDTFDASFTKTTVIYSEVIADGFENSFIFGMSTPDSAGADGYDGEGLPVTASDVTSERITISLDTVNVDQRPGVTPIHYSLDVWLYELCALDEDCVGFCDGGICADCRSDAECGGDTPICAEPIAGRTPKICLATQEAE